MPDCHASGWTQPQVRSMPSAQKSFFNMVSHGMGMARVEGTRQLPDIVPQDNRNEPEDYQSS